MEIIASPWKRWGKHRTYLNGADDERLGYYDHQAGELTVDVDAARAELEAWVAHNTTDSAPATSRAVVAVDEVDEDVRPAAAVAPAPGAPRHAL